MKKDSTWLKTAAIFTLFAVMNFLWMLDRPALANIRAVEVLHLIGAGMCLGVAIISLVVYFLGRHSS